MSDLFVSLFCIFIMVFTAGTLLESLINDLRKKLEEIDKKLDTLIRDE